MLIATVTASYEEKRSNGAYGSSGAFCSFTAHLDEVENAELAYTELYEKCRMLVKTSQRNAAIKEKEAALAAKEN